MTDGPAPAGPGIVTCDATDEVPALLAAAKATVDAGQRFAWVFIQPDGTAVLGFIIEPEGPLIRIRDRAGQHLGIFSDFMAAVMAGLRHVERWESAA